MTVREVLDCATCAVWITLGEDPNRDPIDIKVWCHGDEEEDMVLSDALLNHEVHLMTAISEAILISTNGL